jgi:hypothetical protein
MLRPGNVCRNLQVATEPSILLIFWREFDKLTRLSEPRFVDVRAQASSFLADQTDRTLDRLNSGD